MRRRSNLGTSARLAAAFLAVAAVGLPSAVAWAAQLHSAALPGVTFLRPIEKSTRPNATFDPSADLRIEIFTLADGSASGSPLGPSFSTAGLPAKPIRVFSASAARARYQANWKTRDSRLPNGSTVRVEVRLSSAPSGPACNAGPSLPGGCIGYFDVYLKGKGSTTPPAGTMPIKNGRTLRIKIFIADGALDGPPSGLMELPGPPDASAAGHIPDLHLEFSPADYAPDPELGGLSVSFRTLFLAFTLDTTVEQANALLSEIGAEIIGGRQGKTGQLPGLLYLSVPTTSHPEMDALIDRLRLDPRVLVAVPDSLLESLEIPNEFGQGTPVDWFWQVEPTGGNWALEQMSVPQMWNLNRTIKKKFVESNIGVLDKGFWDHTDLEYELRIGSWGTDHERNHGTHVAGTIAASYNNYTGIDGVTPFVNLYEMADTGVIGGWGMLEFLETVPDLDVVNVSLGYGWSVRTPPVDPALNVAAQDQVKYGALVFRIWQNILEANGHRLPLIVAAAGNDSGNPLLNNVAVDAKWSSPFNYAALVDGVENVLVVGALEPFGDPVLSTNPASFSNVNAQVWAPGFGILSLGSPTQPYRYDSGTSMAAPAVAGLAGYLHSLDPTLTAAELHQILGAWPSLRKTVNAFWEALSIDTYRRNSAILTRLLDIDDGTVDGNTRHACSDTTCNDVTTEDFDEDGGQGDGVIDMSDFRRWRDWVLQANNYPDLALDGAFDNPKKDLNHDGPVFGSTGENVFPDGDFNGDSKLDLYAKAYMPGYVRAHVPENDDAYVTDLQVLQFLFDDPDYVATDLPDLIQSTDIHVNPSACMGAPGAVETWTKIYDETTGVWVDDRYTHDSPWNHVFTLPITPDGYRVRVEALDQRGTVVAFAQRTFRAELASDSWYTPTCSGGITLTPKQLNVVLNTGESVTPSVVLASEGLAADWELLNSVQYVEPASTGGSLASGGEVALDPTITCPARPGGYGGLLRFAFHDDGGGVLDGSGVPESLSVDIVCLDGGVSVDPQTIRVSMLVGASDTKQFVLTNKGTFLYYLAESKSAFVHVDDNSAGVLPTRGRVDVPITITCPDVPGTYSRHIELSFEREDQKPVTVEVPEKVQIDLECHDKISIVRQSVMASADVSRTSGSGLGYQEDYIYENELGEANLRTMEWEIHNYEWVTDIEIYEPIPMMAFGSVAANAQASATYHWQPPIDADRTSSTDATTAYESSFDGSTATFWASFAYNWSQTLDVSGSFDGVNWSQPGDVAAGTTGVTFDLNTLAEVDIAWSCAGQFLGNISWRGADIRLFNITDPEWVPVFYSVGDGKASCSYQGELGPGRYVFVAQSHLVNGPPDVERYQMGASKTASYTMTLTFP
ncbi:MAG: hypothetical protein QOJ81_2152 [Chloroflexota bacterium]|nr:hypothetical protein [Chloroflexota bacterium]